MAEPASKAPAAAAKPKSDKKTLMVTYKPGPEDPSETTWNGHRFLANVGRPVIDNGEPHGMVALAKGNMCFEVEGHDKKEKVPAGSPTTPDAYKAYAVDWFKKAKTASDFEARWDDEEEMRERAGIGSDDLDWLDSLIAPRLAELKKADG